MPLNNVEKQDLPKFKWKLTDAKLDEESAKVSLGSLHLKSMNTEKEIRIADLGIRIVEQNLYWVTKKPPIQQICCYFSVKRKTPTDRRWRQTFWLLFCSVP